MLFTMRNCNVWLGLLVAAVAMSSIGAAVGSTSTSISQECTPTFAADGDCDSSNNSAECGYDSGDCCSCTCQSTDAYTCGKNGYECIDPSASCVDDDDVTVDMVENCGYVRNIGNGYCDSDNNNELCGYDGGDCCECTCTTPDGGGESSYGSCTGGFACIDPAAACVDDDDITADMVENCSYAESIGDGYCQSENNNELCGYDGGDCCECTCTVPDGSEDYYGCTGGFACIDPAAACVDDDDITADMFEYCGYIEGVGNGSCDSENNNELCRYDGGDCCECTCTVPDDGDDFYGCTGGFACIDPAAACVDDDDITADMVENCGSAERIGNGYCDPENNIELCGYDGGDCCECTCEVEESADDGSDGRHNGCTQFACIDPSASCVDDDDITVDMLANCNYVIGVGDGYCEAEMNTPECNYDGGDCCECTCEVGEFTNYYGSDGRHNGCTQFACIDPSASCVDDDDITVDMLADCSYVLGIGDGYCNAEMNTPECNYDGGDCCRCTCQSSAYDMYTCNADGSGFDCVDPSAPCLGAKYHQQMRISENGHTFKVTRFEDGRNTPYRIYFWDEALTGSSYRFDGNGDLVYFKAGSEVYYDVFKNDMDGAIEFSRKPESGRGQMHDDYNEADEADGTMQDFREEFSCNQCSETLSTVCNAGRGHAIGGLCKFCGAIDMSALGTDGAASVGVLCENSENTCAKAIAACESICGGGDDDHYVNYTTYSSTTDDDSLPVDDDSGYVEAGTKTAVSVTATAYDERPGEESGSSGCGQHGCMPALAYDGIRDYVESRWSCSEGIVPEGGQCEIEFTFDRPQDVVDILVDFWKGDERTRTLKVLINGEKVGEFESQPGSVTTSLGIERDNVHTVTLESLGLHKDEWISLLEVHFIVEA